MKKLLSVAIVAMLAIAPVTASLAQDKSKCKKECCHKCDKCKDGKCTKGGCCEKAGTKKTGSNNQQ